MNGRVVLTSVTVIFIFFSCSIFKKSTKNRISTKGSYRIVKESINSSKSSRSGSFEGKVFDARLNAQVKYGTVETLHHSGLTALIDSSGYFNIEIPSGVYQFKISSVGYKPVLTDSIFFLEGETVKIEVRLGSEVIFDSQN